MDSPFYVGKECYIYVKSRTGVAVEVEGIIVDEIYLEYTNLLRTQLGWRVLVLYIGTSGHFIYKDKHLNEVELIK